MKRKLLSILLVVVLVTMSLAACSNNNNEKEEKTESVVTEETKAAAEEEETKAAAEEEETEAAPEEAGESGTLNFEVVSKGFQSTYWQAVYKGFQEGIADLESEHGVKINYNFIGPDSESDIAVQVQEFESAINSSPDAIGLAALDTSALLDNIEAAQKAGIPIIGFDSGVPDAPEGAVLANAATNNYAAGKQAADGLYDIIKDRIGDGTVRIGVVNQDATSESVTGRGLGFIDRMLELLDEDGYTAFVIGNDKYITDSNDATAASEAEADVILEVRVPAQTTTELCATEAGVILNQADTIAIYGSNQVSAEGIITANSNLNVLGVNDDDIIAVGFDSGSVIKDAIYSEVMYGSVTQAPVNIGRILAELMYESAMGNAVEDVDTGSDFYTIDNIDNEEISQNLYD